MKELSGVIEIYPLSGLSANLSYTDLVSGRFEKFDFHASALNLEITPTESNGGTLYNCDKDIVVDYMDQKDISRLRLRTSCIIRLKTMEGNDIFLGTFNIPATVLVTPNLQRYRLSIKCNMLESPY